MEYLSFLKKEKIPVPAPARALAPRSPFLVPSRFVPSQAARGFTLIEMLVVLAIIVVLTAIILFGQVNFNRTLSLNNAAYDIALSIRQAQSYGLSSQAFGGVNNPGYGVYFYAPVPETSYVLFADTSPTVAANAQPDARPGNGIYNSSTELVQNYTLNNGFTIRAFCAYSSSHGKVCTGADGLTALSITFSRPNTETSVKGKTTTWSTYTNGCVELVSANGDTRYVSVSRAGQVQAGTETIDSACP